MARVPAARGGGGGGRQEAVTVYQGLGSAIVAEWADVPIGQQRGDWPESAELRMRQAPPLAVLPTAVLERRSFSAAPSRPWRKIRRGANRQEAVTVNQGLGAAVASEWPTCPAVTSLGIGRDWRSCTCATGRRLASSPRPCSTADR